MSNPKTESEKVHELYDAIGDRGLFVSTNYDVFTKAPEEIPVANGGWRVPLVQKGSKAYASPLLFATLTSLMNHGTMLITGAPGIGKTTGAEFAGHFFTGTPLDEILASEIQGHPQLTEEKMVASYDLGKLVSKGKREVIPNRFLKCPVKILDEGNRTPADVLSIIMRLVDTGQAVYGGEVLKAEHGPLFVTANYADDGTFQFTPPFLDRFDAAVMVTSPQPWDLRRIRSRGDEKLNGGLEKHLTIPPELKLDFDKIRKEIKSMPEADEHGVPQVSAFADFVYGSLRFSEGASDSLARATKGNAWARGQDQSEKGHFTDSPFNYTVNELSVRTAKAMQRYAKALAWFNGKDKVELEDMKTVLPYLLWHKVQPTQKALTENPKHANDRIAFVEGLLGKIDSDYNELRDSEELKVYSAALNALSTGKIGEKALNDDEMRRVVRNALGKIGQVDKPHAIVLANHVASEFNSRYNGRK